MSDGLRIDKWLWFARFCKTRSLAQNLCTDGRVTVNEEKIGKPNRLIRAGDKVVITIGPIRRTVSVSALGVRRGPAPEAVLLYEELNPPERLDGAKKMAPLYRTPGSGRPTKRDRRALEKFFLRNESE
ncbi:MAG: RNA-binding S4 domain-containing protein [Rhodospirillaceae bacterium]|nr:RNA-binding S4 domain-containing protein [Rhodospirillaceae bacterium]MBT5240474.1 RNA-binding S4 domain-containing protein [Rhodospirillaceae bacterium]MBT5564961.1 RNA-binding S4 domain-containing protein [Rhodospirillaceae bacterium]MBT6959858.1 RNA-binding S4 domain-containing protein [Rhodospirillaceae bacterium]